MELGTELELVEHSVHDRKDEVLFVSTYRVLGCGPLN